MTISMESLLEENAISKLQILRIFEEEKNRHLSLNYLCELLEISKFKVQKLIEELNIEIKLPNEATELIAYQNGDFISHLVDKELIREQRLIYLEASATFKLFHEMVQKPITIEKFAKKYYLSLSKGYNIKKELAHFLKQWGFKLKKDHIEGNEQEFRNFLFEFYYDFYNGISYPFAEDIYRDMSLLYQNVIAAFDLRLPPTQKIKLEIFLSICMIRIQMNCIIKEELVVLSKESTDQLKGIKGLFMKEYPYKAKAADSELSYFYLFLASHHYIDSQVEFSDSVLEGKVKQLNHDLLQKLQRELVFKPAFTEEEKLQAYQGLEKILNQIHSRFFTFKFSATTFISEEQIQFFEESHPYFHRILLDFIKGLDKEFNMDIQKIEKVRLYYDYIFAVVTYFPSKAIEDSIYICVDFSHGATYSAYIARTIESFRNLNIVVEEKISQRTDLYVSDFLIKKLVCPQIIWKNPPTADDWEKFGDKVIQIKGGKQ